MAASPLAWLPLGGLLVAGAWYLASVYRLWHWEAGRGAACPYCSGPLGHERPGIRGQSDYRRCYGCGRAVAERYYN
jgi:DNA-directed RNA polymerase subunit RPC12/RpoP